jgi:probable rRNA maturation factor
MPALALALQGHSKFPGLPARPTIARWIGASLERDANLTLRFVDAREGRRLNHQFRARDYATDVLTFAYESAPTVTADIVICVPVIRRAARERGLRLRDHLAPLVVHGTLHAHGYDHDQPAAARRMEACEIRILAEIGVENPYQRAPRR